MRSSIIGTVIGLIYICAGAVHAKTDEAPNQIREVEVGVTAFGFVTGSFIDEAPDGNTIQRGNILIDVPYGGFAGVGGGGGLGLSAMWRGIIGLELQAFASSESAEGTLTQTMTGAKTTLNIDQFRWHFPVLLKIAAPTSSVRPHAFIGFDFVTAGDASLDVSPTYLVNPFSVKSDAYTALRFGLGMEIMLPVPGVDLRIPINFAGNYNYGLGDGLEPDRITLGCSQTSTTVSTPFDPSQCTRIEYGSAWKYQAQFTLGLAYYFL
ncbi:MAG: hypothetical protein VX589_21695 [Myxococcota bacterium]|nr:hypothetical protein [Myxococcota bacterium]